MPSLSPTLLRPLLFTTALGVPLLTHAAEQNPGVQAGISAGATSGAYAHYDVKPLVVPAVAWQGERFFASPGSLGMYLYKGQGLRLSAAVTPYTLRFKTDDVNDAQLRRLHSRQMSAMAGITGEYSADWGMVEASMMREVTGHGGGFESRLHYSYPIQAGRFTWVPRAGVVHSSSRLLDYYYGISDEEALRSGLAAYRPGSTTSPSLQIAVSTPLGTKWRATGVVANQWFGDAVKDSPMARRGTQTSAFISLMRSF
ncbi:TPA: MipA/OmpV family protein [Stenotrophomonas maltophilia]|uniref:MltA-interacting MipA family protein n=1 Tax=Stenotrophomonas maltophilia TaxID=40324 RepID=A0A2J0UFG7_STEMA|nr:MULTISPECIES: MipA/OmpV family protein [Stenotrophomonas]PJL33599.1 MltA-interacting MipA family protein [Stenotrophomonas maltophilia]HDS1136570.1 MipA/OmpV family protein [Stenotrophomonas maltophilia]HDS1145242.1 MipA/OmpV family protein [Stenotrophomonas maltophilia]HDS1160286.1 MipA/OmpV family protein [Stenotrophomonas maltophilia]HEL5400061.1 MipA/OmpV family protein [Stenotrophomonas maltophilia]